MNAMVNEKMRNAFPGNKLSPILDEMRFHLGCIKNCLKLIKNKFRHEYDKISFVLYQFDNPKLEIVEKELAELLLGVKIFLSKKFNDLKKRVDEKWKNNFYRALKDHFMKEDENWKTKWENDKDEKFLIQFKTWMQELNYNEFLKQLDLNVSIKEELDGKKNFINELKKG